MILEQFVTKATLLVDGARYPARHKDRMVWDTLITRISNDILWSKIIKKGPDVTLAQVLKISRLETATQQSHSQMSNTKPPINFVRYRKKRKNKGGKLSQQQSLAKFHRSGSSPSNSKPDDSGKLQTKGKICYRCGNGKHQPDQKSGAINAICNKCGKERTFCYNLSKGQGVFMFL